ncbi:MAG TPA: hypothetical protein VKE69_09955 [Planctomycetota bacterium]|nr:hypothetical protein [Planctomycetota bacterium]
MPFLLGCLALGAPRLVLFLVWLFSDYLGRAYAGNFWPFLGFLFLPLTTLAYAWAKNSAGSVTGFYLVVVVIAVLLDLGMLGGGARARRARTPG